MKVSVAEGAFDKEVELTAKQVFENEKEYQDAEAALQDAEKEYESMAEAINPYGDGKASERIAKIISNCL